MLYFQVILKSRQTFSNQLQHKDSIFTKTMLKHLTNFYIFKMTKIRFKLFM